MSIAQEALEKIRKKLLDLSARNNLLNSRASAKSLQIVDELPDIIYDYLLESKSLEFLPLPDPHEDEDKGQTALHLDPNGRNEHGEKKATNPQTVLGSELPFPAEPVPPRHLDSRLQTPYPSLSLERRCKKILEGQYAFVYTYDRLSS